MPYKKGRASEARVSYFPYSGCRVSGRWLKVLRAADRAGVQFSLNSGHRTFAEQQVLWDAYQRYLNGGPWAPKAAYPSHTAPHIRTGKAAHAIDVSSNDGGANRLAAFLRRHGGHPAFPVGGEPWHIELPGADLKRLARKLRRTAKRPIRGAKRVSARGLKFLIAQEGVRRYAYNDSENHATFGVGHLIHRGPVTDDDRREWGTPANPKSMVFVLRVLRRDLVRFNAAVREATSGTKLYKREFDACLSLCFNIGIGGFKSSTVARKIREKRFRSAADAFLLWDNPPVLRGRRERERKLFLRGY
jgi:GH24 family phage-related lysozyme (muramidase)